MGARIRVGTSGWVYRHWRGVFYPEALAARRWFEFYAAHFDTVELNNTFYRLPTPAAVDRWRDEAPRGFLFAAKGSRFLTHMKRLLDEGEGIARWFDVVGRLGDRLGPVLWQLPPRMAPDPARLDRFLARMPPGHRHAVEFRDPRWYIQEVRDVLARHGAAFVEHDLVDARAVPTGGWRYLRFHGVDPRGGAKYAGRYGRRRLAPVAKDILSAKMDTYVYFNNDVGGHAVADATDLRELLGA